MPSQMSPAYWIAIKARLDQAYYVRPTSLVNGVLWGIVAVLPIAIGLHLTTAIKRSKLGSFWLVRRDSEGYLQENRNVLIPILSAIKTALDLMCILSLKYDMHTHFHNTTLILLIVTYVVMHSLNWMRTWASVYSMPPPSLYNFSNRKKTSFQGKERLIPPWLFNSFVLGGIVYAVIVAVIFLIRMCRSINRINHIYQILAGALNENAILSAKPTSESRKRLKFNALLLHSGMQDIRSESVHLFSNIQLVICLFLIANFISVVLFWWSISAIMRCLNVQLEAYSRSLRNRSEAIQLGMLSAREETHAHFQIKTCPSASDDLEVLGESEAQEDGRVSKITSDSLNSSWRSLLPTLQRNTLVADRRLWNSSLMGKLGQKGPTHKASLRRQYAVLRSFKMNTLWQASFITLLALNYEIMGITLKADPFGVPKRTSTAEVAVIIILWSNLIWGIGGTAVATLSTFVAFSRTATSFEQPPKAAEEDPEEVKSFDY